MDCSRARTRDPVEWLDMCPPFSRPLAERVREWVLTWAPDLEESIKWNMVCYSGRKLVFGISACQKHLGVTFFRGIELTHDPAGLLGNQRDTNATIRTARLTSLEPPVPAALRRLIEEAIALDAEPRLLPPARGKREPIPVPDFFAEALRRQPKAAAGFERLPPSCQREYLVWLTHAKRPETREKRLRETLRALVRGRRWADRKG